MISDRSAAFSRRYLSNKLCRVVRSGGELVTMNRIDPVIVDDAVGVAGGILSFRIWQGYDDLIILWK